MWRVLLQSENAFELGGVTIAKYSTIFKTARVAKKIWRIINTIASIWGENMLGYLALDIICFSKLTVFLELHSRKTVCFSERVMSVDKYSSTFSRQMEAIVYIALALACFWSMKFNYIFFKLLRWPHSIFSLHLDEEVIKKFRRFKSAFVISRLPVLRLTSVLQIKYTTYKFSIKCWVFKIKIGLMKMVTFRYLLTECYPHNA